MSGDETAPGSNMSLVQPPVPMGLNFTAVLKSVGQFHCITVCVLSLTNFLLLQFSIASKFHVIMRFFINIQKKQQNHDAMSCLRALVTAFCVPCPSAQSWCSYQESNKFSLSINLCKNKLCAARSTIIHTSNNSMHVRPL